MGYAGVCAAPGRRASPAHNTGETRDGKAGTIYLAGLYACHICFCGYWRLSALLAFLCLVPGALCQWARACEPGNKFRRLSYYFRFVDLSHAQFLPARTLSLVVAGACIAIRGCGYWRFSMQAFPGRAESRLFIALRHCTDFCGCARAEGGFITIDRAWRFPVRNADR